MAHQHREFDSLDEALRIKRIPYDNHAMIRRIVDYIGIARSEESGAHIRAIRRDGGHDLLIKSGYTTGFSSYAEGVEASGGACFPNSRTGCNWLVAHPINSLRESSGPRDNRPTRSIAEVCPPLLHRDSQ